MKTRMLGLLLAVLIIFVTIATVIADDGALVRKSMSYQAEVTVPGYPDEAEHAFIKMMGFYVPSQAADGTIVPIDYERLDGEIEFTRDAAKPLVGVFLYGPVEGVEGVGFVGHGRRDAYAAVSLDDGLTWKKTNLSESADKSSSDVIRSDIPLFDELSGEYPGDAVNMFHSVADNKVLAVWPSRYCTGGEPNYALDTAEPSPEQAARRAAIAAYLGIDLDTASPDDLYLIDMYGVGGSQGSVDYAEDKFEQNHVVGEVPYNCLWAARGVLVNGDDPRTDAAESSYMRWFKAERLTSGVRDVNRVETKCVEGAGCAITWQEDPEGLRPGQGEGPGEGWSGAIANRQTDVWYSYIPWGGFETVQDPADDTGATPLTFEAYTALAQDTNVTQQPQPFVPFAMPMRMTDNAKCNVTNPQPYCNGAAISDNFPDLPLPTAYGLRDMCAESIQIPTGQSGSLADVCVTEDGLPLIGNTASTRPRLNLFSYSADELTSAFALVVTEEDKGLGAFGFTDDFDPQATGCDPEEDEGCVAFDEGKNIWYYSFSMSLSDSLATGVDGLPKNMGSHGNILNQPEVSWEEGEFYPVRNTVDMWDFSDEGGAYDFNYDLYNTEIARRGSLLAQSIGKAAGASSRLIALPAWKQGAMNQGGPADVMVRRIIMPSGWDAMVDGNPYAYRNMDCTNWAYDDGSNPHYPDGICLDPAINLSGTIPDSCIDSADGSEITCPTVDFGQGTAFGIGDTNPVLQGTDVEPNTTKVLAWHQCPAGFTRVSATDGTPFVTCENDARTDSSTLRDQSWYNPLEVAKGHRGFLDGDFVMMLYAWSPNWRLNTKGNDRYELYIRRSFDGAGTWTTLPEAFAASDGQAYSGAGAVSCETFRSADSQAGGTLVEPRVCNSYQAGAGEQARNVTQLKSMATTTLDPRYAATTGSITDDPFGTGYVFTPEDTRDPSRYFIAYETGDNTTTADGEPEPLDLFYSRAVMFGDNYQVWAEEDQLDICFPNDPLDEDDVPAELIGSGFCNEFDQLEQGSPGLEASESSLTANPGGEFMYGAWSQIDHETHESDAMARRVWWLDEYTDYGLSAAVFGVVDLQGATPHNASGLVTAIDNDGVLPVKTTAVDPTTGAFSFDSLPVAPSGSDMRFEASHDLHLTNTLDSQLVNPDDNLDLGTTTLLGGDATNDGAINVFDLSCIGTWYDATNPSVGVCGSDGSSDVNGDGVTNIADLSLAGGNYLLSEPQPW